MDLRKNIKLLLIFLAVASMRLRASQVKLRGRQFMTYKLKSGENSRQTVVKLRFQTIHPNGLFLYSKGAKTDEYLQLDLFHGQVRYQGYMGGIHKHGKVKILNANKELNDGEWHNVTLVQRGRTTILEVDKLQSSKIVQTDYQDLHLDGNIFIGGMRSSDYKIHRPESRNFSGCIEDLTFRGANLIRKAEIKSPEVSVYGNVAFKCKELDYRVVTLPNPNTGYRVTVHKLHADIDTFSTSFYFRTYIKQGLLLARSAIKVKLNLRLSHGTLIYNLMAPNGSRTTLKLGSELDDGEWHKVNASVRGREVRLQLDGKFRTKPLNQSQPLMLDFANKPRLKIFLGAFEERDFPGFVGCVYNLRIDSHRITVKNLKKSGKPTNINLRNTCRLQNRCQPNPCKNRGICTQTWDRFYCNCKYTVFEGERCNISIYKATCEYYKAMGLKKSALCLLDSVGGGTPYAAYCNLTRDSAKTTIRHDKMTKTRVGDGIMKGSDYLHEITYSIGMEQIEQLIRKSRKCRQHVRFHCFFSKLLNSPNGPPHASWLSRDSERQNYWGGAEPGSEKCACGMDDPPTCKSPSKVCNCDNKARIWQVDEGYLTDKNTLPVTALEFNAKSERSDFTVGPLECWGGLDKHNISMIQPQQSGTATDNPLEKGCPTDPKHTEPINITTSLRSINKVSKPKTCPTDDGNFTFKCKELDYRVVTLPNPNTGYRVTVRKLHADIDTFSTSFYFRTYIKQGLLLSRSAIKFKLNLRLSHGTLIYNLMAPNGSRTTLKLGSELDDGEWHKVNASVRGREVRLQLDEKFRTEPLNQSQPLMLDFANKSRLKIFLGAFEERDFPGFVGCVYNLRIDSHRITVKNLKKSGKHTNTNLRNTCRLQNRCQPNPCKNGGICSQTWDRFYCNCKYTVFEGERCDISIYKATCEYYKAMGLKKSALCLLDSVGGGTPYTAYCNLTQDAAKTTIRHNKMTKTRVGDGIMKGSDYLHEITYSIGMEQIEQLIRKSSKCRQHVRFHCLQSKLLNSPNGPPHASWLSRDSERQNYWGGAEPGSEKCACGMDDPPTCKSTAKFCNCDEKARIWQVDEGYLTDKNTLPVTALEFNAKGKRSDFTVGPLECWGGLDKHKISMIQPQQSGMATDNPLEKGCPTDPKHTEPINITTSLRSINKVSKPKTCPTDDCNFYDAYTTSPTSTPNVTMVTIYPKTFEKEIQTSSWSNEFTVDNGTGELVIIIAIAIISGALVVIVLLSMKLGLRRALFRKFDIIFSMAKVQSV